VFNYDYKTNPENIDVEKSSVQGYEICLKDKKLVSMVILFGLLYVISMGNLFEIMY